MDAAICCTIRILGLQLAEVLLNIGFWKRLAGNGDWGVACAMLGCQVRECAAQHIAKRSGFQLCGHALFTTFVGGAVHLGRL